VVVWSKQLETGTAFPEIGDERPLWRWTICSGKQDRIVT
jgi:hypothetical protein